MLPEADVEHCFACVYRVVEAGLTNAACVANLNCQRETVLPAICGGDLM